jgi:hypothetical protein
MDRTSIEDATSSLRARIESLGAEPLALTDGETTRTVLLSAAAHERLLFRIAMLERLILSERELASDQVLPHERVAAEMRSVLEREISGADPSRARRSA